MSEEQKLGSTGGLNRRQAIAAAGAATAGLALVTSGAAKAASDGAGPVAETTTGKIRGYNNGPVKVFKGIPYGASTAGKNRFMAPQPPQPWSGVRDATMLGQQSPQLTMHIMAEEFISLDNSPYGEDCLRLNVWTPAVGANSGKRPVMVWFHGGGFSGGSGGDIRYDGTNLAHKHDVVLVTVNERLNTFGFLYLGEIGGAKYADSGNAGVLDLIAALKWVRDNIHEFGGDPNNVTIFGQSGGGGKVTTLMAMPAAKGLFHKAIAESGLNLRGLPPKAGTEMAKKVMARLGAKTADDLQKVSVDQLLAALTGISHEAGPGGGFLRFAPIHDGRNLPSGPFDPVAPAISSDVPLICGSTLTEIVFMPATPVDPIDDRLLHDLTKKDLRVDDAETDRVIALYRKGYPGESNVRLYQLIATDNWLTVNVATIAERKAALKAAPAYVYHFEKTTPVEGGRLGAPHTLEIPYVFDNLDVPTVDIVTGSGKDRYPLADKMSRAWTNFARTGNPNVSGLPHWSPYSSANRAVMIFNDKCKIEMDPHHDERVAIAQIKARSKGGPM